MLIAQRCSFVTLIAHQTRLYSRFVALTIHDPPLESGKGHTSEHH